MTNYLALHLSHALTFLDYLLKQDADEGGRSSIPKSRHADSKI